LRSRRQDVSERASQFDAWPPGGIVDDLDVAQIPADPEAGTEGFAERFLGGESGCEYLGSLARQRIGVRPFRIAEDVQEGFAPEPALDVGDLDHVDSDPDNHGVYSYRSASTGSTLAALSAGYTPKNTPTLRLNVNATVTDHIDSTTGRLG